MKKMSMLTLLWGLLAGLGCQNTPNRSEASAPEKVESTRKIESSVPAMDAPVKEERGAVIAKATPVPVVSPAPRLESKPAPPISKNYTLPAATKIPVRLIDAISTETNKAGDTFLASLAAPLRANGVTLFAKDTIARGKIITLEEPGRVSGVASISFQLTEIHPKGRSPIPLQTEPFTDTAKAEKKKDAAIIGGGTAIGTAIGAIAGGKKGAAIGAIAGGGGSTGYVLATKGQQLKYPSETPLTFRLAKQLTVRR